MFRNIHINSNFDYKSNYLIDFTVQCPHCDENIYQSMDRYWFEKTMGHSFPTDGVDGDYEAECPECKNSFTIEGFCQ